LLVPVTQTLEINVSTAFIPDASETVKLS
jgi:hypothetical protein